MALKTDGTLWGWGKNFYGRLGQNSINSPDNNWISSPVQVPGTTWNDISDYYDMPIATKTDGTLWGWGNGGYGRLGQNTPTSRYSSPVQIPGGWTQAIGGNDMVMAFKA